MIAAQRRHRLCAGAAGAQAHWTGGGGAWRRRAVPELEASSHTETIGVIGVSLDQQVHIPAAVDQEVLGPVQVQTQGLRHLGVGTECDAPPLYS